MVTYRFLSCPGQKVALEYFKLLQIAFDSNLELLEVLFQSINLFNYRITISGFSLIQGFVIHLYFRSLFYCHWWSFLDHLFYGLRLWFRHFFRSRLFFFLGFYRWWHRFLNGYFGFFIFYFNWFWFLSLMN